MKSTEPLRRFAVTAVLAPCLVAALGCGGSGPSGDDAPATEVSVEVGKIVRATLSERVEAWGRVEPEPAGGGQPGGGVRLTARAPGVVLAVVAREGDEVAAGSVLVRLDDSVAAASEEKARHALEFAEQVTARQRRLVGVGGTSQKVVQEAAGQTAAAKADLAAAGAELDRMRITTPMAGRVARIFVAPGQAVDTTTVVAEVVDPSRLVVTAGVAARDASRIAPGATVQLYADSSDVVVASGTVSFVSPQLDPASASVLVRVAIAAGSGLRPGEALRLRIVSEERRDRLAAPKSAVVTDSGGLSVVFTVDGDKAVRRSVRIGIRDGDLVEVDGDGIHEGDAIVTVGAYGLPADSRIRIKSVR